MDAVLALSQRAEEARADAGARRVREGGLKSPSSTIEDEMLSLTSFVSTLGETILEGLCFCWDLYALTTPGIPHIVFCASALLAVGSYIVYGEISIGKLLCS